jgi:hypothetical protein
LEVFTVGGKQHSGIMMKGLIFNVFEWCSPFLWNLKFVEMKQGKGRIYKKCRNLDYYVLHFTFPIVWKFSFPVPDVNLPWKPDELYQLPRQYRHGHDSNV